MMEEIAEGVFVETRYEGVNVGAVLTDLGVICIDAPSYSRDARDWAMRVERLQSRPIKYIILTDGNGDRILNTRWLNAPIVTHEIVSNNLFSFDKRYPQGMVDSLYRRNQLYGKELTNGPVDRPAISFGEEISIVTGSHDIRVRHAPGPSAGSSWVEINEQQVIFSGDIVVSSTHPIVADMLCSKWLASLNELDGIVSSQKTKLIPGRGSLKDEHCLQRLREYLLRFREIVKAHLEEHRSRNELQQKAILFIDDFPLGNLPLEWVRRQIQAGLERLYDELNVQNDIYSERIFPPETGVKPW